MSLMQKITVSTCLMLLAACPNNVPLPETLSLKWHETRTLEAAKLEVRFESVTDSRCPINAVCIWEGDGTASFKLTDLSTGKMQTLELHTNQAVGSDSVNLAGIGVKMLELNPFPGTVDASKLPDAYTVTLELSPEKP
jgi:hypothetical protein